MALPDELRDQEAQGSLTDALTAIGKGLVAWWSGRRLPPRHDHDDADAAAAAADAAVTRALEMGREEVGIHADGTRKG